MRPRLLALLAVTPALAGCAATKPAAPAAAAPLLAACPAGETAQVRTELYFGLTRPHGPAIARSEWREFVSREITPRFPDGVTEIEANGQWRDRVSNRIGREPSRILLVVAPATPDLAARIAEIGALYRRLFDQQAVGVVSMPVCADF
ncbi:DUF3574 domain-containing protein [Lichenicoccus sp.]|uniref:DUF3574 domain-containing protein n=1 Tax=Lichenicoccus sp. TaxID=2781899 RepID=UPI003D09E5B4